MARKRDTRAQRAEKDGITTIEQVLPELANYRPALKEALIPASELPDPKLATFSEKIAQQRQERPTGPRKRDAGEPFNILASADARLDRAGDFYEVTLAERPTAEQYARHQKWGFDDMTEHDTGEQWAGHRKELIKQGTDPNHVAMVLKGKDEERGR